MTPAASVQRLVRAGVRRQTPYDPWARTSLAAANDADRSLVEVAIERLIAELARNDESEHTVLSHRPFEIKLDGFTVRGTAHLVWLGADGADLIGNVYVVGSERMPDLKASPDPEHEIMANLAAYALRAPRWSIAYVDAFTGKMVEHLQESDPLAAEHDLETLRRGK